MMIFIDTDTLSYFLTGNTIIRGRMQDEIDCGNQICLTCINVYEVIKGLRYRGNKNKEQDFYNLLRYVTVFRLDDNAIQKAADIYASLRKKGITIGDADILIASIVITNGGKFVTNNDRHFQNVESLEIEKWIY